jgi:hypothetical protein
MKTFFYLNGSNGVLKNPSFHTDFKNVNLIFVKIAPKKSASPLGFGNNFERSQFNKNWLLIGPGEVFTLIGVRWYGMR